MNTFPENQPVSNTKPTFNVSEPFYGITTIQCNEGFKGLLLSLLNDFDQLEKELYAFKRALENPTASRVFRENKRQRNFGDSIDQTPGISSQAQIRP